MAIRWWQNCRQKQPMFFSILLVLKWVCSYLNINCSIVNLYRKRDFNYARRPGDDNELDPICHFNYIGVS